MLGPAKKKAVRPSKVVKPKKDTRRSTISTKNHRFQSFSERISKLKIDPIRRRRKVEEQEQLDEKTNTYFGRSLEEWRDLNLSRTFTAFVKDVAPLCDNLPVVLHNDEKIMDLLVEYIQMGDAFAIEPILNLLSHFARDLDVRFEKHFQRAVSTITSVAATNEDLAVVEWCFNSLAWQFRYLSRVLTPDLRPLYDLMSPFMGKSQRKPFIIRFTAESLSFLVRKAAATYERDPVPLDLVVSHMLQNCADATDLPTGDLYRQGVMTLLSEAVSGVQNGINSSGPAIIDSCLKQCEKEYDGNTTPFSMLNGILTSLIHHCTPETFIPILQTVLKHANDASMIPGTQLVAPYSRLVFTVVSVRKGARITDWPSIISLLQKSIKQDPRSSTQEPADNTAILSLLAVAFQTAPIHAILPALHLFAAIRSGNWAVHFLQFCDLFARLGRERFQTFLLPEFQNFVLSQWQQHDDDIQMLLPHLGIPKQQISCSSAAQERLLLQISEDSRKDSIAQLESLNASLSSLPYLEVDDQLTERVRTKLLRCVERALDPNADVSRSYRDFGLGACFATILEAGDAGKTLGHLWPQLCSQSSEVVNMARFWSNLVRYLDVCHGSDLDGSHVEALQQSLLQCLTLPSHEIRESALDILQRIYTMRGQQVPPLLLTAITIESTPISLETSRTISMNIRKLGQGYNNASSDPLIQRAIPRYCFGLLHLKLTAAWDDSVNALAEMSTSPAAEETITELSQMWLDGALTEAAGSENDSAEEVFDGDSQGYRVFSDFECPNLAKISAVSQQVFEAPNHGYPTIQNAFERDHSKTPIVSADARQQALRVLRKIPSIAEKRSRMLVPVLLSWAAPTAEVADDASQSHHRWSRKDQKAMLAVFAQFVNPKVLYKSAEVYEALLNLCANGDVEIQQSALKALFAWKDPAINKFKERLTNLLDEAKFRDEVTLLQAEDEDGGTMNPDSHPSVFPVLLRLLYGRAISGGKEGQKARRRNIFVALSNFGEDTLHMFVDISLAAAGINGQTAGQPLSDPRSTSRQQFGMLNMFDDLLETLGAELEPCAQKIIQAVLSCVVAATKRLNNPGESETNDASLLRSVRQVSMQCLAKLYAAMPDSEFDTYTRVVGHELLLPRLDKFPTENLQSISGTLRLLSAWSASSTVANYMINDLSQVVLSLAELLRQPSAQDQVRAFVLKDILGNLLESDNSIPASQVTALVSSIGEVINLQPSKDVLDACVAALTKLARRISNTNEATAVIAVCTSLLTKPGKIVSSSTKFGLLETLSPLLDRFKTPSDSQLYIALCGLFSRMRSDQSRSLLSTVFAKLCFAQADLADVAEICEDLNSMSNRLDEADLERRGRGFVKIFEGYQSFSARQWQPMIHNSLFYIRDADDMVNRSNATRALERFIEVAGHDSEELGTIIATTLLPAIERGMTEKSELVRAEYIRLLGSIVVAMPDSNAVKDMLVLTVGGDDEASFFTNVLHIQQHRRLRALRRLADEAINVGSNNVNKFLIPLLEHFVFDAEQGDTGRTLSDQTITTLGQLAKNLKWSSFRYAFKRYIGLLKSDPEHEKFTLRLLSIFVDALHADLKSKDGSVAEESRRARSDVISRDFLPPLVAYLHLRDESTVDRRMPVAVTIVKLLQSLPGQEMSIRLAPVLTDVCHVLRSRSVEARDQTRKALAAILDLVGPTYFGFLLKELRGALQRGYQLHVLSYTVHSLLVHSVDKYNSGDLNHCLHDLVAVVMDDIFGVTGQEKEAEEYVSSMKEIKSSKSFDTMELLSKVTPVPQLGRLIKPLRSLLMEKLDAKSAGKIDNLLTRLRKGLDQNPGSESREMLGFCHEVIRRMYSDQAPRQPRSKDTDPKLSKYLTTEPNHYLIQPQTKTKIKAQTSSTSQTFKLVSFAFNLLRKVLRRHEDLLTAANLSGFLPMIGDALVQRQTEVQISAMRLFSAIMKVPLNQLESDAPVYVNEAVRLLKAAPSMTGESAKAALELITAVLREKRSIAIRDKDIGDTLKAIKTDIDEPDRQGIIYKFIRAVLGRKIMITEVYEIMDEIAKIVVTNPDRNVRDGARSACIQFIMEYPQGKDRWNKQARFFVDNLLYEHPAGRQSTMELLHQILQKIQDEVFAQLAFTLFAALVPVHVSDDDAECRQMAGILISRIFERADSDLQLTLVKMLDKWLQMQHKPEMQVAGLKCWQLLLRARLPALKRLEGLLDNIADLLETLVDQTTNTDDDLVLNALRTFSVLLEVAPVVAFGKDSAPIWEKLQTSLKFSQPEIRLMSAQLLEQYFSDLASTSSKLPGALSTVPLQGSQGLNLSADDMRQLCYSGLKVLCTVSESSEEVLITQTARNLAFLGRCFSANGMAQRSSDEMDSDDEEQSDERDPSAIANLLNKLSSIARQDRYLVMARIAAMECQVSLLNHISTIPNLAGLMRPAYLITDPNIPHETGEQQSRLAEKAVEMLELLQKKAGAETYLAALSEVRKDSKARREDRRTKRRIEAVSAPERWAKDKKRKHEARKATLKARGLEARGKRRGW